MVEFLENITGENFTYEKGKRYVSIDDFKEDTLKDKVFVRQPNSPKKRNWWTEFSKDSNGKIFRIIPDNELGWDERYEENRLLQL